MGECEKSPPSGCIGSVSVHANAFAFRPSAYTCRSHRIVPARINSLGIHVHRVIINVLINFIYVDALIHGLKFDKKDINIAW